MEPSPPKPPDEISGVSESVGLAVAEPPKSIRMARMHPLLTAASHRKATSASPLWAYSRVDRKHLTHELRQESSFFGASFLANAMSHRNLAIGIPSGHDELPGS